MSNLVNASILAAGMAFASAAGATCGTRCGEPSDTTINLTNGNTNTVTANPTATANATGGAGGSANVGVKVGNTNIVQSSNATESNATGGNVETGAVQNDISYNSVTKYKAAASSAYSGSVIGSGHGCFEHQGGWGLGVQVVAAGASITKNDGEKYNTKCPEDQAALAIINKTGNPVNDAIAAETAAHMAPNTVGKAVEKVASGQSRLVGLFATAGVATSAAQPAVITAPTAIIVHDCPENTHWNEKLQSCTGGQFPAPTAK